MRRSNLGGANLSHADLRGAILNSADLSRANLKGANLNSAILLGADLGYVRNISGVRLLGAKYDINTTWPRGFDPDLYGAIRVQP
jgi:uncharacterized protein YjbI with pentapeptide repeats